MKHCKLTLLLITIGLVSHLMSHAQRQTPVSAAPSDITSLIVWHKDGTKVLFSLSEQPRVTYDNETVRVESATLSAEYDFESVHKMTYGASEADGISELQAERSQPFTTSDRTITFLPAEKELHVQIATAGGIAVKTMTVRPGQPATVSLNNMPKDIYLVTVNGITYKINIR